MSSFHLFECHAKNLNFLATCCRIRTELRKTTCNANVCGRVPGGRGQTIIPANKRAARRRKRQTPMTKAVTSPAPRLTN